MNTKNYKSNFVNEDINPCIEESNLCNKCLNKNLYNYNKCTKFFENYNNCKKFWGEVSSARRREGIRPTMPNKAERTKILEEKKKGNYVISVS